MHEDKSFEIDSENQAYVWVNTIDSTYLAIKKIHEY